MLGETFEDIRMSFIAEKVQHQPLVMAFHAQGEGWELYGTSSGKTKFWGVLFPLRGSRSTNSCRQESRDHSPWYYPPQDWERPF